MGGGVSSLLPPAPVPGGGSPAPLAAAVAARAKAVRVGGREEGDRSEEALDRGRRERYRGAALRR